MAQSRLSAKGEPHRHPRRRPVGMGQAPARLARLRDHRGGPDPDARARTARVQLAQGRRPLVHVLPEKTVTFEYGAPFAGERQWWSGSGDDLVNSMTRDVDLTGDDRRRDRPARPATTSKRTSTTCTCRRPPMAAPRGRASTAPSTGSRSSATAATTRRSPARPGASGSTSTPTSPAGGARSASGSSTAPTVASPRTASSPMRSSSAATVPRSSPAVPRTATRAGCSTASRRPPARRPATSRTTTSRRTAASCPTTST